MRRIGLFGGGQLGMMLAEAGKKLGFEMAIFAPGTRCPARAQADIMVHGEYEDNAKVMQFARSCDVLGFEFENIPAQMLETLQAEGFNVAPSAMVLHKLQDRLREKRFLREIDVAPTLFARVDNAGDLPAAIMVTSLPAILKTRRFGYDGKGQSKISHAAQAEEAFERIHHHPAILEAFVPFVREISVIAARNAKGEFQAFPVTENLHEEGILRSSIVPANCSEKIASAAISKTRTIADALHYTGVLAVEFFETEAGELLVNEIAPRVHNSGHWSRGGAQPDQFEMHIRAISGMDLPVPQCADFIEMKNLIGPQIQSSTQLQNDGWDVLNYGKSKTGKGRKMGHAVRTSTAREPEAGADSDHGSASGRQV